MRPAGSQYIYEEVPDPFQNLPDPFQNLLETRSLLGTARAGVGWEWVMIEVWAEPATALY